MKKKMLFAVCTVLLAVFCSLGAGAESSPKDGDPSASEKADAASDAPEKTAYDADALLQDFFDNPNAKGDWDDLTKPEDLRFLDIAFLENNADRQVQQNTNASDEISSEELDELKRKQYQNASGNPEYQESVSTDAFRAENAWMDTHFVYTYPVPEGLSLENSEGGHLPSEAPSTQEFHYSDPGGRNRMDVRIVMYKTNYYTTDDVDYFRQSYKDELKKVGPFAADREIRGEDGIPRRLVSFTKTNIDKETLLINTTYSVTLVYMHDNCSLIRIDYCMESEPGKIFWDPPTKLEAFEALASKVAYHAPESPKAAGLPDWLLTEKDFDFHVDTQPETAFLGPGQSVQIIPTYERSDLKESVISLTGFSFFAVDTDQLNQGHRVPVDASAAAIDAKGTLKAGKVSETTTVTVVATCEDTGVSKASPFFLLPSIKSVGLSEKKITLYAGDSAPIKLQGSLTPSNAWIIPENAASNMVWSSDKPDILSVTDNRDTTATIEAIAPGKATVTLTETTSKKKTTASITILQPVTGLSIDGPDTLAAGSGAGYKAVLEPKNVGNKKVQWSIDVDESIAAIKSNGQLKIAKGAPSGTVITLTCTAEGAATPPVATKTVTVE